MSEEFLCMQAVSDLVTEAQTAAEHIQECPALADAKPKGQAEQQPGTVSWKWDILRPVQPVP